MGQSGKMFVLQSSASDKNGKILKLLTNNERIPVEIFACRYVHSGHIKYPSKSFEICIVCDRNDKTKSIVSVVKFQYFVHIWYKIF